MPAVITEKCIKCKNMDCVEVCPVDAFYEGENMLVINPRECLDCGVCIDECPIGAIVFDSEPAAAPWLEINAKFSELWPNVTFDGGQTPSDAAQFQSETGKYERYFSPEPGAGDVGKPKQAARKGRCAHCRREGVAKRFLGFIRQLLT